MKKPARAEEDKKPTRRPYADKLKQFRAEVGLTQPGVAGRLEDGKRAAREGVDAKRIRDLENEGKRVQLIRIKEILEVLYSKKFGTSRKAVRSVVDHEFSRYLIPDTDGGDPLDEWLEIADDRDRDGDAEEAARITKALFKSRKLTNLKRLHVATKHAEFCDHLGKWDYGLKPLLAALKGGAPNGSAEREWAEYQAGILCRRKAEGLLVRTYHVMSPPIDTLLDEGSRHLQACSASQTLDVAVAAEHQLGVIQLLRGDRKKACKTFQKCLKKRKSKRAIGTGADLLFRVAYEHRRIAQCYVGDGQRKRARDSFDRALELAESDKNEGHERLLKEIEADMRAWGL